MGTHKTGEKLGAMIAEPKVKAIIPMYQSLEVTEYEKCGKS